jgi:hypothetical protein
LYLNLIRHNILVVHVACAGSVYIVACASWFCTLTAQQQLVLFLCIKERLSEGTELGGQAEQLNQSLGLKQQVRGKEHRLL